jgi:hypothetical protein
LLWKEAILTGAVFEEIPVCLLVWLNESMATNRQRLRSEKVPFHIFMCRPDVGDYRNGAADERAAAPPLARGRTDAMVRHIFIKKR